MPLWDNLPARNIDAKTPPLGQASASSSVPVTFSNENTAAIAKESKQDVGNISLASIDSKLTTISSASLQSTGNSSLNSIDAKTPALGQALAAASVPVVLTAAQISTLTPPAAVTGFATSALQTTGNSNLGATNESAAGSDTSTSGLNGLLKRFLQRFTLLYNIFNAVTTSTLSTISSTTSSQVALAANANRKSVTMVNNSNAKCTLYEGAAASTTNVTYRLDAGDTYESFPTSVYLGVYSVIWDSAHGNLKVTERT